ncbi:cupredoxin domain-containing protein [Candidatus Nitrosocosmicus sp. T]
MINTIPVVLFIFGMLVVFSFSTQYSSFDYDAYAQLDNDTSSAATITNSNNNGVGSIGDNNQPNINAESIFNTKTMTLGDSIKNLVILIPNEGHHAAGEDNEARFLDQHFVPENAVVSAGTTIGWFNGDVGHERTIDVKDTDGSSTLFNTGEITDMQLSQTFTFNEPGLYNYQAEGDPGVTMTGTVTVVDNSTSSIANSADNSTKDTVGVLMVPTQDIDAYVQDIQNAGLTIDSMYDFNDLRGGQKGTGDVQTLIVWTSQGNALDTIIPPISELSSSLPYS